MEEATGGRPGTADTSEPGRVLLTNLRVSGTPLEQSLERAVSDADSGHATVAAFSSSI